jgi:membrane protein implicated in regulation of membrane protease activity
MSDYLLWFMATAILVGLEMATGTFYLLLYGIAAGIGGLAALAGASLSAQFGVAALCAFGGTIWLRRRSFLKPAASTESLDIGQRVEVESWKPDGSLRVRYRGSSWDAELAGPVNPATPPTTLYIIAQRGNTLILAVDTAGA